MTKSFSCLKIAHHSGDFKHKRWAKTKREEKKIPSPQTQRGAKTKGTDSLITNTESDGRMQRA